MEEFIVFVADLDGWMANYYPYWAAYHALMACCLIALDKFPGVHPVGIGEMLLHAITKTVIREGGGSGKEGMWEYPAVRRY